jgi:hypothetical protein
MMDLQRSAQLPESGCAVIGCYGVDLVNCYRSQFCRPHTDQLEAIRKELQLAKKRKKIYLEYHMRLHEVALRGIDERHACRMKQLEEVIIKKQGSLAAASCLFVCRLELCNL